MAAEGDTKSPSGAPVLPWRSPGRPAEHLLASCCLSTSAAGPEDGQTPSRGPSSGGPCCSPLLDRVLNCPPLSCAAAENEVNASQAPVLHLQATPCALVHNGSILGRRRRERQTDGQKHRETQRQREKETDGDRDIENKRQR